MSGEFDHTPLSDGEEHVQTGPGLEPVGVARPVAPMAATARPLGRHPMYLDRLSPTSCGYDLALFIILTIVCVFVIPEVTLLMVLSPDEGSALVEAEDGDPSDRPTSATPSTDQGMDDDATDRAPQSEAAPSESVAGDDGPPPEYLRDMIMPLTFFRCIATVFLVAWVLSWRRASWSSVGLWATFERFPFDLGWGVLATVICLMLLVSYSVCLQLLVPGLQSEMVKNAENLQDMFPRVHWVMLLLFSLAVGIFEELIFRGFMMTRLRRMTGNWVVAVILSTAIFTVPHAIDQTLIALGPIAILSILVSVVTIWRQSLIPAIVAHALFDFTQLLLLFYTSTTGAAPSALH
ncbi:MAG: lysostaphin resistance A-like protein [Phycisphaerae bacterium]